MKNIIFTTLEKKPFVLGNFVDVVQFLYKKNNSLATQIILPCSFHDLALVANGYNYDGIDYCTSDSMWLTYFFCLKYGKKIERVYGPSLMRAILNKKQHAVFKNRHFFLAANTETNKKISQLLIQKYPNLDAHYDFLSKKLSKQAEKTQLKLILQQKPNFIWLGIGSPKQIEIANWLKSHSKGIKIFCVGAAFDFISGNKRQAPLFIQQIGLEWLFRLCNEPSRLWRRYLIIIPSYLLRLLRKSVFKK